MGYDFHQVLSEVVRNINGDAPAPAPAPAPAAQNAAPPVEKKHTCRGDGTCGSPDCSCGGAHKHEHKKECSCGGEHSHGEGHTCSCRSGKLTLSRARLLIEVVEAQAKAIGVNAVIAVAGPEGNPMSVDCMDDAYIASYDIAVNKAYTSVSLKMPTADLATLAAPGGSLYGIQFTNQNRIVIFGGGQPLRVGERIVGGLGVSGGSAEQDTYLAEFGRLAFLEIVKQDKENH